MNSLRIGSINGGDSSILISSLSQGEYADGHLFYVRERVLMAHPFDAEKRQLTGDAFPRAENVAFQNGASLGYFSVSAGGVLTYLTGDIQMAGMNLGWHDRSGILIEEIGEAEVYQGVQLSPDNSLAAVSIADPEGTSDLWIWDLERQLKTRFTFSSGDEFAIAWAPDGDRMAFASLKDDNQDLYVKSVTGGSEVELLHDGPLFEYPVDWSPDAKHILFIGQDIKDAEWGNYALDLDTGEQFPINSSPDFSEGYPVVSPNGRWLSYTSNESGREEIYVTAFPEGGRKWQISTAGGQHASWRSDGSEMFFVRPESEMLTAVEVDGSSDNFVVGGSEELFPVPRPFGGLKYDAAADGQRFLVLTPSEAPDPAPLTVVVNWTAELQQN